MKPNVLIVYVQLGNNPSPTLQHYAEINSRNFSNPLNILITDNPSKFLDFPGQVVRYNSKSIGPGFKKYIRFNKAYSNIAGGYWRYTMERLFSFNTLVRELPSDIPVIHIESDVLILFGDDVLNALAETYKISAIPRYSSTDGIASIMFSPSLKKLAMDLVELDSLLSRNLRTRSDMSLLGLGLKEGILAELPSTPESALTISTKDDLQDKKVVFDGLAYGQYLFGQDPVHTHNRRISGYLNKEFPVDLSVVKWHLDCESKIVNLKFSVAKSEYIIGNLHMHSKIKVDPLDAQMWRVCLGEANGELPRTQGPYVPDLIHTIKSSAIDRIRIIVRRGVFKSMKLRISGQYKRFRKS